MTTWNSNLQSHDGRSKGNRSAQKRALRKVFLLCVSFSCLGVSVDCSGLSREREVRCADSNADGLTVMKGVDALDPYLQILNYNVKQGNYENPGTQYIRVLVKTTQECRDRPEIPVLVKLDDILTSYCSLSGLETLGEYPEISAVEIGGAVMATRAVESLADMRSRGYERSKEVRTGLTGKGVVIGIVESGLAVGNRDSFDRETGRCSVSSVWDQTDQAGISPRLMGESYGTEYSSEEIIRAIGREAAITKDPESHGTAVASLCGGRWGIAPDAEVVFVKFSRARAALVEAVWYIFDQARDLGRPCVICLTYAGDSGRRDGESLLEQALDTMIDRGRIVVCSSGNREPNTSFAGHSSSGEVVVPITVESCPPRKQFRSGPRLPELTLVGCFDSLEIVNSSDPENLAIIRRGDVGSWNVSESYTLYFAWVSDSPREDPEYVLLQWEEKNVRKEDVVGWRVSARMEPDVPYSTEECRVHAWIADDSSSMAFPTQGDGARMEVCVPATLAKTISVASCDGRGNPSVFSPSPSSPDGGTWLDFYMCGEQIEASIPFRGEGPFRRHTALFSGSSFSAPQLAGYVALLLQRNPELGPHEVERILSRDIGLGQTGKKASDADSIPRVPVLSRDLIAAHFATMRMNDPPGAN